VKPSNVGIRLQALWRGAVETAVALPILVAAAVYLVPEGRAAAWAGSLPLLYFGAYLLGSAVPFRRRYLSLLTALAAGAAHGYWLAGPELPGAAAGTLAGFAFTLRGLHSAGGSWWKQFPPMHRLTALIAYFIAYLVLDSLPPFDRYMPLLTWTGLAAFLYLLFDANRQALRQMSFETGERDDPAILAHNRLLMTLLMAIALAVALFRTIRSLLVWLRDGIADWLNGLPRSTGKTAPPPAGEQTPPSMEFPGGPPPEPAAWLVWLEKAMFLLLYAGLAALAVWLLALLFRKLPPLLRKLFGWLSGGAARSRAPAGYEDSVESLLDRKPLAKRLAGAARGLLKRRGPKWSQLKDNRERIRFLYAAMLRKSTARGYGVKPHLTPCETGRDLASWSGGDARRLAAAAGEVSGAYDRARYGSEPVDDATVNRAKALLDEK